MILRETPAQKAIRGRLLEAAQIVDRPIIMMSRHNFEPPLTFNLHQKHDPILQAAYPILHDFAHATFTNWCNPLEIEPLFSDDAVFLHQAMLYGAPTCGMYAIARYGFIAKVRLFLHAWNGQVFVQDKDNFIVLGEWLSTLPPAVGTVKGERMYRFLQCWWETRGPMLRLMDLPTELWSYILQLAFGQDVYPGYPDRLGYGHGPRYPPDHHRNECRLAKRAPVLTKAVLFLNKTIHGELQPLIHKQTRKCFDNFSDVKEYIKFLPRALFKYEHLRVMELDFELREYILSFGVEVLPFKISDSRASIDHGSFWREATMLKHLPSLSDLRIRFPAPSDGIKDPWYRLGHFNGFDGSTDWRGNSRSFHISCQKLLVDWILTFAKEHIDAIPKISLTGYIKDSTKTKWDRILKEGKNNEDVEEEIKMAKKMIQSWDRNALYVLLFALRDLCANMS